MIAIYDVINTVFFVFLVHLFIGVFVREKRLVSYRKGLALTFWIILEIIVVNVFSNVFLLKALATIIISSVFEIVLYRDSKLKIVLLAVVQYLLEMIIEFSFYTIAINFTGYIHLLDASQTIVIIYGGVLSQLFYFLLIIALNYLFKNPEYKKLDPLEIIKFLVFPIISVSLILAYILLNTGREITDGEVSFYTYLSICVLVANIYMFWLLRIDLNNKITMENSKIANEYASDLKDLYIQITEEHKEIAAVEHEYKNYISVINSLVSSKKYDELETYLKTDKILPIYTDVVNTGNAIASAILNAKYAEAMRKGIQVRFNLTNLSGLPITDTELVIILSNLFNNAIEACEKMEEKMEERKIITAIVNNLDGLLFVSFSNTVKDKVKASANLKTDKQNSNRHGYGIRNIKQIVHSYDGTINIEQGENYFSVSIMIPSEIII